MNDKLNSVFNQVQEFRKADISHSELGTVNGFNEANNAKNSICDYLTELFDLADKVVNSLHPVILEDFISQVNAAMGNIRSKNSDIEKLVQRGTNISEYPTQRQQHITQYQNQEKDILKRLQPLKVSLQLENLKSSIGLPDQINKNINDANDKIKKITAIESEAKKVLSNLQETIMQKGVSEGIGDFDKLKNHHAGIERQWFIASICFASCTLCATIYILVHTPEIQTNLDITLSIFRRLLLLTIPSIFLKLSLSRYGLERNLSIIYSHRSAVLLQYKNFENAIGDDLPSKNQFRLEIAKYIFSDPKTGFIQETKGEEISVNPIINMIEKISSK